LIRADGGLLLCRKLWEREVTAHAEGRPLKKWYRSVMLANAGIQVFCQLNNEDRLDSLPACAGMTTKSFHGVIFGAWS